MSDETKKPDSMTPDRWDKKFTTHEGDLEEVTPVEKESAKSADEQKDGN